MYWKHAFLTADFGESVAYARKLSGQASGTAAGTLLAVLCRSAHAFAHRAAANAAVRIGLDAGETRVPRRLFSPADANSHLALRRLACTMPQFESASNRLALGPQWQGAAIISIPTRYRVICMCQLGAGLLALKATERTTAARARGAPHGACIA